MTRRALALTLGVTLVSASACGIKALPKPPLPAGEKPASPSAAAPDTGDAKCPGCAARPPSELGAEVPKKP